MKRRNFLDQSTIGFAGLLISPNILSLNKKKNAVIDNKKFEPFAVSTWNVPMANNIAGNQLDNGADALDAAVKGVAYEEANILNTTVGKGGSPDRDGNVTLDACVMNHEGNCGAVLAVQNITHVAALAKEVMIQTPHVILAGADRVELCSALDLGGLTPSHGLIKKAIDLNLLPIHCLIRPRQGHFFYSKDEIQLIEQNFQSIEKVCSID